MNKPTSLCLVAVALCAAFLVSNSPARAAEDNTAAVRAASNQFYSALSQLFTGDMAPMDAIWSHRKDVTYMEGCGRLGQPSLPPRTKADGRLLRNSSYWGG